MSGSTEALRVGIVGCGTIAETHIPYIHKAGGFVAGIADVSEARANELADRFGVQRTYGSVEELLEAETPQVVHVLTPPHTHADIAERVLGRGTHALVEKPMAQSEEEAERMLEAAATGGALLTVDHNRLFDPPMLEARRLVDGGHLGDLVHVESYQAGSASVRDWLGHMTGGGLGDLLPHPLYLQLAFMGAVTDVQARTWQPADAQEAGELRVQLRSDRCTGTLIISTNARPRLNTLKLYGTKMSVEVNFNNLTIIRRREYDVPSIIAKPLPNLDESFQLIRQTVGATWRFVTGSVRYYPGMGELIGRFYDAIRRGSAVPVTAEQGADVVRVASRIWREVGPRRSTGTIRAVG